MRFNNQSPTIMVLYLKLNYHRLNKVRIYRQINKSISKFLAFQNHSYLRASHKALFPILNRYKTGDPQSRKAA